MKSAATSRSSRTLDRFVAQPHLSYRLKVEEIPEYLELVEDLLARVTELHDNLVKRMPSTTRLLGRSIREVRAVLRLDVGEGFNFDEARQRIKGDNYAIRRVLADLVTDEWLVQDSADHWMTTEKGKELQFRIGDVDVAVGLGSVYRPDPPKRLSRNRL